MVINISLLLSEWINRAGRDFGEADAVVKSAGQNRF